MMRPLLVACLLVAACNTGPNAQNVANDELAIDQAIDALHTAQMQILQLQAEIAAMRAVLPQVPDGGAAPDAGTAPDAGAMPPTVKTMHLVYHLGMGDEKDLGPWLGDAQHRWVDAVRAIVPVGSNQFYFESADCSGKPYVRSDIIGYSIGPADTVIFVPRNQPTVDIMALSEFYDGKCQVAAQNGNGMPVPYSLTAASMWTDTKVPITPYGVGDLLPDYR